MLTHGYTFLPKREQWYAYAVDIIDTILQTTKTKTRKT